MEKIKNWHHFSIENVRKHFDTDLYSGLTNSQIVKLKEKYGENILKKDTGIGVTTVFLKQFKSPLVFILLIAGVITIFLREYIDASVIFIALIINVVIGALQEERADKAFEKLNRSQQKYATAIRAGRKVIIPSEQLVPGDLIIINAGMYVPADARLVREDELAINESSLTGEWVEVSKNTGDVVKNSALTQQFNMVWMGTLVTNGSGQAIVVATGGNTQIGSIAKSLSEQKGTITPLQRSIRSVARYLTYVILGAIAVIVIAGILRDIEIQELFLIGIAIAVAAMPEGLPAAVTVVLAIGMESILKKNGLIRNLVAAETLGSTTVILTDKTGTLTKADMRISSIISASSLSGYLGNKETGRMAGNMDEHNILAMAMLNSDAFVEGYDDALSEWIVRGRPVERAIVLAGLESGLKQEALLKHNRLLDILPFESEKRFAATLHMLEKPKNKRRIYFSGAPEILLGNSAYAYMNGKKVPLTQTLRKMFEQAQEKKSDDGMRVLALAFKDTELEKFPNDTNENENNLLKNLTFGGLIVIRDPIRQDVPKAIKNARNAGTQVIMLTGDNINTARRVAVEVGISGVAGNAVTGADIEDMSDKELLQELKRTKVFARVLPHQKMRIVSILKKAGEVVAMTGDGINDAPALRRADIGIALGSGTEVAKEASDMILLNNSFSIIVHAIEEGRRILDNLKKIVAYLLSTSFSEIFLVGGALIAGAPLPLLPAQILWTNIIEEGFMNFSFAFEPKEGDIMKRNPRSVFMRNIITSRLRSLILILSLTTGIFLTLLYFILIRLDLSIEEVRTIMFAVLSVDSIFFSFSLKDLSKPVWRIDIFSNKYLLAALAISIGVLILALFVPLFRTLLSLVPMSSFDLMLVFAIGLFNLFTIEAVKYFSFERAAR